MCKPGNIQKEHFTSECCICLDSMKVEKSINLLCCTQHIHEICVIKWVNNCNYTKFSCPNCRNHTLFKQSISLSLQHIYLFLTRFLYTCNLDDNCTNYYNAQKSLSNITRILNKISIGNNGGGESNN